MNRIKDYKQLAEDISTWIKDYAVSNNIKSLVVGVSGGIDSAVVSTLCTMTGLPTWTIVIPIHSNKEHTRLANLHCSWLNICTPFQSNGAPLYREIIDLTQVYDALFDCIPGHHHHNLSYANTKSRLRMTTLYNIACTHKGIVVGTGNKIEDFGCGFFTKFGDGGCDISPIADLYKSEVRLLGSYLGVLDEIINSEPTDGLWGEHQKTDEQAFGATYEELEQVMSCKEHGINYLTGGAYAVPIEQKKRILSIYEDLHNKNLHKIVPIPIYKLKL